MQAEAGDLLVIVDAPILSGSRYMRRCSVLLKYPLAIA